MRDEHLYVVAYDISDQKRWRRIFRLLEGFGEWLQLSIFQCRLSAKRHAELIALIDGIIHHDRDHVIFIDIGLAHQVMPQIVSLGKPFSPIERAPLIV